MSERLGTVLFADVSGSTRLYESAGDTAALDAISRCLDIARRSTESSGGRVVKTIGDEVMSLFPGPDAAANAAADLQVRIDALPEVAGSKLGMRVGFHHGPVLQRDDDVFGDTVNTAARLVAQAKKGEVITSEETAERLGPIFRSMVRHLYAITVRGKAEEVAIAELVWRRDANATIYAGPRSSTAERPVGVRLHFQGRDIIRRRENDSLVIGRDLNCGLVIADETASRNHCTIERRHDKVVLRDHSTNGTFVTIEGDAELLLRREEIVLRRHGWIAFGQPRASATDVVEFYCE